MPCCVCAEKVKACVQPDDGYSQFEITFAIAMLYYVSQKVDLVILETGMGGLLDCTNIINNSQGWNFDPWLQLERRGDYIHARTSKDCITWTEMPNSPVNLRELFFGPTQRSWPFDYKDYLENYFDGKSLRVGIYQTTYSDNRAAVTFDNIEIWQKKP